MHAKRTWTLGARRARKLGGILLIACLLTPLLSTATVGAAASPTGDRVGVSAGSLVLWESDAQRVAELNAIAATGAKWFGVDVDWASIEYQRGKYRWAPLDSVVLEAKARGLRILGTIAYSPKWARPASCPVNNTHCLPAQAEDYANFARVAAARYGTYAPNVNLRGAIQGWQVWNEPNHYPFVQTVDVAFYTYMLKLTFGAIKGVDPWASVLAGGLSPAPDDPSGRDMSPAAFLSGIYFWGGKGWFDAVGHHPYSFPCSPLTDAPWNAFYQTLSLYMIMAYNGDGAKRIWGTEVGAPTGADLGTCGPNSPGVSVTEATQSLFAAQYISRWTNDWAAFTGPLIWFQIRDNGTDPMVWDDHLGLLHRDFTPKPSYQMFQYLLK